MKKSEYLLEIPTLTGGQIKIINKSKRKPDPINYWIDDNGCYICEPNNYTDTYPKIRGKTVIRFLWETKRGSIPKGLFLCHTCDNPICINLEHIFLGTNLENIKDSIKKRRHGGLRLTKSSLNKLAKEKGPDYKKALDEGVFLKKIIDAKRKLKS